MTTRTERAVENPASPRNGASGTHPRQAQDPQIPEPQIPASQIPDTQNPIPPFLAALGGGTPAQLAHLRKHLEFQKQEKFEKARINWSTVIDRNQSRRHITTHLHQKINLKATTLNGQDFHQPGKSNTEEALQNMDKMTFMVRSRGRIEARMGVDRHLSWNTRYRIFRQRYANLPDEIFWEIMREDHHRTIAPKFNGFPMGIQVEMLEREQARKDLIEYNKHLRELISTQGGNPDEYKKAVIRVMRYCYSCQQLHPADDDHYQRCPDCRNQLGPKRDFASLIGEWPRIIHPIPGHEDQAGTETPQPASFQTGPKSQLEG